MKPKETKEVTEIKIELDLMKSELDYIKTEVDDIKKAAYYSANEIDQITKFLDIHSTQPQQQEPQPPLPQFRGTEIPAPPQSIEPESAPQQQDMETTDEKLCLSCLRVIPISEECSCGAKKGYKPVHKKK